ncbi:MAG: glycosyltransferase family A protein [bacterium]
MSVSVVLTALNDQATLMESIESVLSQTVFPDTFGIVAGESYDRTRSFVEFYDGEYDFLVECDNLHTALQGRSELRLAPLSRIETDYVLFLPADSFLYPQYVETIGSHGDNTTPYVTSGVSVHSTEEESMNWNPWQGTSDGSSNLPGPIHPSTVAFRTELIKDAFYDLSDLNFGPFSMLGWYYEVQARTHETGNHLESVQLETWNSREGENSWTKPVIRSVYNLIDYYQENDEEVYQDIERWLGEPEFKQHEVVNDFQGADDTESDERPLWLDQSVPLFE